MAAHPPPRRAGRGSTRPPGCRPWRTARRADRARWHLPGGTPDRHRRWRRHPRRRRPRSVRMSREVRPHAPATATAGSSRATVSGVTMSPIGSTCRVEQQDDGTARTGAGRCSSRRHGPAVRRSRRPRWRRQRRIASRAAACSSDGPSATMTIEVPAGAPARSPASARARSLGSIRGDEHDRRHSDVRVAGSRRDGGAGPVANSVAIHLVRRRHRRQREVRAAVDDLPAGGLDLGAQRSASVQSPAARAAERACAASRTACGMCGRVIGLRCPFASRPARRLEEAGHHPIHLPGLLEAGQDAVAEQPGQVQWHHQRREPAGLEPGGPVQVPGPRAEVGVDQRPVRVPPGSRPGRRGTRRATGTGG